MTSSALCRSLKKRYRSPLTISALMTEMLFHPSWGAYAATIPIGHSFTTAPEISQMFGETIALWSLEAWESSRRPTPILLIELGPGRGTLLTDFLRVVKLIPEFYQNLHLHLVEASPSLRKKQRQALKPFPQPLKWHQALETIPDGWSLIIANEFFDCLPIHQFQKTADGWRERLIALDDGLRVVVEPSPLSRLIPSEFDSSPQGSVFELSPARENVFRALLDRLNRTQGALILSDYGDFRPSLGDTLQAVYRNQNLSLSTLVKGADLSSHVDFSPLISLTQPYSFPYQCREQRRFLLDYGLLQRAKTLKKNPKNRSLVDHAVYRLIDPSQMGTLFKIMTIHSL